MSVDFRRRNQTLLFKLQSAEDTEASPTVGSDAVRVKDLQFTPNLESIDTSAEVTGSLSAAKPIAGGGYGGMRFGVNMRGAGTAGQAPDWGPVLRACGFSETLQASAETGTAQSGATGSITLAASGPSSTDDAYKGMVIEITGGTGSGQTRVISGYVGSTKVASVYPDWDTDPDNTSEYDIHACALYRPVTDDLEWGTAWAYQNNNSSSSNSIRRRIMDAMGTFSMRLQPGQPGMLDFTFRGEIPAKPDGVTHPGAPTYVSAEPESFRSGDAYFAGSAVKFSDVSIDLGAGVQQFPDPSAFLAMDSAQITERRPTGRLRFALEDKATRDTFNDWLNNTSREGWFNWGSASGKRISLFMPEILNTGDEEGDQNGFATSDVPVQLCGFDQELWVCVH